MNKLINLPKTFWTISPLIAVMILCACTASPYHLSDQDARSILLQSEPITAPTVFGLGRFEVVSGFHQTMGGKIGKGQMSEEQLRYYRRLQTSGLVAIDYRNFASSGFQGWEAFQASNSRGLAGIANVVATESGKALSCQVDILSKHALASAICLSSGSLIQAQVTQNQHLIRGAEHFRIVRGVHEWQWNPTWLKVGETKPGSFARERKFEMLLKFDPYAKVWSFAGASFANRNADFEDRSISQAADTMTNAN